MSSFKNSNIQKVEKFDNMILISVEILIIMMIQCIIEIFEKGMMLSKQIGIQRKVLNSKFVDVGTQTKIIT